MWRRLPLAVANAIGPHRPQSRVSAGGRRPQPLLYLVHRIPFRPTRATRSAPSTSCVPAGGGTGFLGTFVDHPDDEAHRHRLAEWCEESHVVASTRAWRGSSACAACSAARRSACLITAMPACGVGGGRWWPGRASVQAVVFSGPMAQYLDVPGLTRRIIDFCDLDSAKWTQYAPTRWPMSWLYRREGARLSPSSAGPPPRATPACSSPRPRPNSSGRPRPRWRGGSA